MHTTTVHLTDDRVTGRGGRVTIPSSFKSALVSHDEHPPVSRRADNGIEGGADKVNRAMSGQSGAICVTTKAVQWSAAG
jgi:hypothetical protein